MPLNEHLRLEKLGSITQTIRSDGELTMNKRAMTRIEKMGIMLEASVPYAPAQNGVSERSAGVTTTRARAMRIGARLPEDLWPEILPSLSTSATERLQKPWGLKLRSKQFTGGNLTSPIFAHTVARRFVYCVVCSGISREKESCSTEATWAFWWDIRLPTTSASGFLVLGKLCQ